MSTRGLQVLKQKGIPHAVIKYEHEEKGARFASRAVGYPLSQTIKTLVVLLDEKKPVLVLMPGDCQLSMKKVATACKSRKAALADTATAERLTGYLVGGISPFGTRKPLPVLMEASLTRHTEVMVNAGQRGVMVRLSPEDLSATLNASAVDLAG